MVFVIWLKTRTGKKSPPVLQEVHSGSGLETWPIVNSVDDFFAGGFPVIIEYLSASVSR